MIEQVRTVEEINERIRTGDAHVVTATEMKSIVAESGAEEAAQEVDVVTTGTFGAMCSSGVWMNFGHSEPPMKMCRVWLNDVEAYAGVAAVDAYIGATQLSETNSLNYGGGHVIEDLLNGKPIHLRAQAYGTDCYPRRELSTEIELEDLNQAVLSNPRNGYERYPVAVNTSGKTLYTYMGKLLPDMGNATFCGAGALAPIMNDPTYRTIGIGTRVFLGGGEGYVIGNGTQHNPQSGSGTLMVQGDLKGMNPEYLKGATMTGYGCTLFVGFGIPIPILTPEVAKATGITDDQIVTNVYDYSQQTRDRKTLRKVTYRELKSGSIEINGKEVRTAPLSSFKVAERIGKDLQNAIVNGRFLLTTPVARISASSVYRPMNQRAPRTGSLAQREAASVPLGQFVFRIVERCIHCGLCIAYCPAEVFYQDEDGTIQYDPDLCIRCGECRDVCPHRAIVLRS